MISEELMKGHVVPESALKGVIGLEQKGSAQGQAEASLQSSGERFRTLVSNIPGAVYRCACDPDWTMSFISDAIQDIAGYPAADFLENCARSFASIIHPDDRALVAKAVFDGIKRNCPYVIEYRLMHADSSIRWVYEKGQAVRNSTGEILWLDGAIFDITDQKQTGAAKARIEAELKDNITELSIINELSEVLLSTRELNEILHMILIGATANQALGFNRAFLFLINAEQQLLQGTVATGALTPEQAYMTWARLATEGHSLKDLLDTRKRELSSEDVPINLMVRQIRIPLDSSASLFSQAVYERRSFNIVHDSSIHPVDHQVLQRLGTDCCALVPLVSRGRTLGVLVADNFVNRKAILDDDVEHLRSFANHASLAIENSHLYESLQEKVAELSQAYNELKENRDKLLHYERLSAIGEMAAKVAHDIRNPLMAIGGFARLILKKEEHGEIDKRYIQIIVREIDRLEKILADVLCFANPANPHCKPVDLNSALQSTFEILGFELEQNNIVIEQRLEDQLPRLWLDEDQIIRVFINVIKNSIQAMPEGGTITVATMREDQWVRVEVADTGTGISDEDIEKVFNPFFTSKSTGSGLGLTLSAQIVKNHGGSIEVYNKEPNGITFIIKFPMRTLDAAA